MKKQRAHFSREERQKLLEDFQRSKLRVTDFARQNGLSRPLLSTWLIRYACQGKEDDGSGSASAGVPMQEIQLGAALGQPGWAAEVILPNGLTVRLDGPGRAQLLEGLLGLC